MTVYSWGKEANIEKLEIVPVDKKSHEAVLYASPNADPGELAKIPEMLRSINFIATPDVEGERFVLRIRGFKNPAEVAVALEQNGFVKGFDRKTTESEKKHQEKAKPGAAIRKSSLKFAGIAYLIGDISLIIAGLKRKDKNEVASGAAFMTSSVALARYGEKKPDKAFSDLYKNMLVEFAEQGVEIPDMDTATVQEMAKPGGIIERIESFLYDHPAEVNGAISAVAGLQLLKAGLGQENKYKTAAGAFVTAGVLVGLLVKEKKHTPTIADHAKSSEEGSKPQDVWKTPEIGKDKGIFGKVASWVQEKPMRTRGYLSIINNGFQAASALDTKKTNERDLARLPGQIAALPGDASVQERQKLEAKLEKAQNYEGTWVFNMFTSAAYFVANSLVSITSKNGGEENTINPAHAELFTAAASILAAQPEEVREGLISKMAFHFAEQKDVGTPPDEIAKLMREKIEAQQMSPWLAKTMQQSSAQADSSLSR